MKTTILIITLFLLFTIPVIAVDYGQNLNVTSALSNISKVTEIIPSETPQTYTAIKKEMFLVSLENDEGYYAQLLVVDWDYLTKKPNGVFQPGGNITSHDNIVVLVNIQGTTFYDINDTLGTNITINSTEIAGKYLILFKTLYTDNETLYFNLSEISIKDDQQKTENYNPLVNTRKFLLIFAILLVFIVMFTFYIIYKTRDKNAKREDDLPPLQKERK